MEIYSRGNSLARFEFLAGWPTFLSSSVGPVASSRLNGRDKSDSSELEGIDREQATRRTVPITRTRRSSSRYCLLL